MKKNKTGKIVLLVITAILILIVMDSGQALLFNKSPIIRYHYIIKGNSDVKVIDKGILVDTYYCNNDNVVVVLKGSSYSCITKNPSYTIEDTSKNVKNFSCDLALEEIYRDAEDVYYLPCIKSDMIIVTYKDGTTENVKEALANGKISIRDLDKFNITYLIK